VKLADDVHATIRDQPAFWGRRGSFLSRRYLSVVYAFRSESGPGWTRYPPNYT